jgi:LytS/YehU family sensor histidine kinase
MDAHLNVRPFLQNLMIDIWMLIYITVFNYLLFEYTLPKLSRKRILFSILILIFHGFIYMIAPTIWNNIGLSSHIYAEPYPTLTANQRGEKLMGFVIGSAFYFGIIRHYYNHTKLRQSAQQLLIEKQQAELNYLKSQTNPHFLFNTLNNIYSLSRDKSDLAPESILRLSKILRYMLYETSGPYTAIGKDLKIMNDYIELEKLRYDESLRVDYNNDIEDMNQGLPPLLLIPLVENAFKYGASETRHQPFVDIHLSIRKRQLLFIVRNSTGEPGHDGKVKESIGLSNLRRQLELLYTEYDLNLKQEAFEFIATLKINLASHV